MLHDSPMLCEQASEQAGKAGRQADKGKKDMAGQGAPASRLYDAAPLPAVSATSVLPALPL